MPCQMETGPRMTPATTLLESRQPTLYKEPFIYFASNRILLCNRPSCYLHFLRMYDIGETEP